jgi:aminopeptidase N
MVIQCHQDPPSSSHWYCNAVQGESKDLGTSTVLRVDAAEKHFVFEGVTAKPVPSLLRNFSAPVKMEVPACSVVARLLLRTAFTE